MSNHHFFIYVVGSGASGLLFDSDLKDKSSFIPIFKSDFFPSNVKKIHLLSYMGLAEDENNEIFQWGELDYAENKKVF